jgi:hypothetical protein
VAIGNQPSANLLNNMLSNYVSQMNKLCSQITQLQSYVVGAGAAGLQALPVPFTAADAASYVQAVNYLNTMAALWYGTAGQATAYNFQNQMNSLVGPSPS